MRKYDFKSCDLDGVYVVQTFCAEDGRGWLIKDFSMEVFTKKEINFSPKEIVTIFSRKGVLRGLHFQREVEQAKLIRCLYGHLWTVVVDIMPQSKTYGRYVEIDINDSLEVYIPGRYAVGTLALEDSMMLCTYDEKYYEEYSDGIIWNDEKLKIQWPIELIGGKPLVSEKDLTLASMSEHMKGNLY